MLAAYPPPCSTFPTPIKLALAVILGGIAVATVSDVQYSAVGLVYGLLAVLATTMFQVQVKHVTKDKGGRGSAGLGRPLEDTAFWEPTLLVEMKFFDLEIMNGTRVPDVEG